METATKSQAIDRVIAITEIQRVLHRYAFFARNNIDWVKFASTFRPEARFHLANNNTISAPEWQKILQGEQAKYIRHHITTTNISLTNETEALATAQFFTITDWSPCDHWGEWVFSMTRDTAGVWLISEKKIVLDGVDPKGWAAATYQHS